jgi:hypothetical protein
LRVQPIHASWFFDSWRKCKLKTRQTVHRNEHNISLKCAGAADSCIMKSIKLSTTTRVIQNLQIATCTMTRSYASARICTSRSLKHFIAANMFLDPAKEHGPLQDFYPTSYKIVATGNCGKRSRHLKTCFISFIL